jgi:hypothetical protein
MSLRKPAWKDAELWVVDHYDLEHEPGEPGERWYDAINPRTDAKYQVKSAETGRRFRVWADQHRSLTAAEGQNAAWYVFVTESGHRRMRPSTVTAIIRERGGWNESGHERGSKQHKIPINEII